MKVCCISDLHGRLPKIEECDLLVISGDICIDRDDRRDRCGSPSAIFSQSKWLGGPFKEWLDNVPAKEVVACWGNHDWIGEKRPDMVPKDLRWHILTDETKTVAGLKIFGSPHQPWFYDWAFNAPPGEEGEVFLEKKFSAIEPDTDIVIVHGPPRGYGDVAPDGRPTGSYALLQRIMDVKPKLTVSGHIHCGRGHWEYERGNAAKGIICNASVLNEEYKMVHEPMYFEVI